MAAPRPTIARRARTLIEEGLRHARVLALTGARQVGKTTLAREVCHAHRGTLLSLDDHGVLEAVLRDPHRVVEAKSPVVIDEFQFGGDRLLRAIKSRVDEDTRPGQFLLTGSTRFLTVPTLSETLAGRIQLLDLWPLAQVEIRGRRSNFVDRLFGEPQALLGLKPERRTRHETFELVCAGGFPEARTAPPRARRRWFESYVQTVTQRDAAEVARIQQIGQLPRILELLGARTAQEIKATEIARDAGLPRTTLASYLTLLETLHQWFRLPAWSRNLTAKVIRHPKGHLTDSGLAAHLVGADPISLSGLQSAAAGPLLETFVAGELARQLTWAETGARLFHYRERDGGEVDLVLESRDGRVACVEVKPASSVERSDFRTIDRLHDKLGAAFATGIVLHLGPSVLPFGPRRMALPVSALWAT